MFTGTVVSTIVRTADVFGKCVGRELQGLPPESRRELADAFERALDRTEVQLNTKTASIAIPRIKSRVRAWLGL